MNNICNKSEEVMFVLQQVDDIPKKKDPSSYIRRIQSSHKIELGNIGEARLAPALLKRRADQEKEIIDFQYSMRIIKLDASKNKVGNYTVLNSNFNILRNKDKAKPWFTGGNIMASLNQINIHIQFSILDKYPHPFLTAKSKNTTYYDKQELLQKY